MHFNLKKIKKNTKQKPVLTEKFADYLYVKKSYLEIKRKLIKQYPCGLIFYLFKKKNNNKLILGSMFINFREQDDENIEKIKNYQKIHKKHFELVVDSI
jgi:hypothetical protein